MKKVYTTPAIRIQLIDTEDIMESISIAVIDSNQDDEIIKESSEILSNGASVWDEE